MAKSYNKAEELPNNERTERKVDVSFSGELVDIIEKIKEELLNTPDSNEDVIYKALMLLNDIRGKELKVRDPKSRIEEVLHIWKKE